MTLAACIAALLALTLAALTTGQRLYWMFACCVLIVLAYALVSALAALARVRCRVMNLPGEGERGRNAGAILNVKLSSPLPVGGIEIVLSMPSPLTSAREIHLSAGPFSSRDFRLSVPLSHRGIYKVGIARVRVRDVFGVLCLSRRGSQPEKTVLVYPRAIEMEPMRTGSADSGNAAVRSADEDAAFPSDVRAWRDGDELKRVHWKLTMRRRELIVRTFDEAARPDTLVLADLSPLDGLPEERLNCEDRICEAALGAAKAQVTSGDPVTVPLFGSSPSEILLRAPQDVPLLRDALTRVKFDSPYTFEQVLMQMQGRLNRTGALTLVTANLSSRCADMALRMRSAGVACRVVWVTDDTRDDAMALLERLRMDGVEAERVDPWERSAAGGAA